jgi:3-keto-disaccharide hydrolase
MNMRYLSAVLVAAFVTIAGVRLPAQDAGWVSLFDGKTLNGWRVGENPSTFKVEDGAIVINGPRAHLYYDGPVQNHEFKNFEFKADVMTTAGSNSGIYFHTAYQEGGWPSKGYEVQVNNSHTDPKRTAGLYAIKDNMEAPAKDDEWFTMQITVRGKQVTTMVNGKTIVDYTEPDGVERPKDMAARLISSGTFALQGHDPKSKVLVKNIMVKPLP